MTTKLTLTVKKSIIDRGKVYAKKTGRSLSELVENYLESVTQEESSKGLNELSPNLKMLVGVVKLPIDFEEDTELRSALEKKHL
jgi:hypothetical protein